MQHVFNVARTEAPQEQQPQSGDTASAQHGSEGIREGNGSPTRSRRDSMSAIARSLRTIESREQAAYHRPCLLVQGHRPGSGAWVEVCLLGTFSHKPMDSLSQVIQCFSIPISPNVGMEGNPPEDHLHAFPEWPPDDLAWLMAYKYLTRRRVDERWYHKDVEGHLTRRCSKLDATQRAKLNTLVQERLSAWRTSCEDPVFREACEKEFLMANWGELQG
ncbi:hypothetical protein FKP32DRAFT_1607725 [Trametes sanguinea]|nr:hypothetical protein FKP32DRAFT_1607725 [Trametes sanguinea]